MLLLRYLNLQRTQHPQPVVRVRIAAATLRVLAYMLVSAISWGLQNWGLRESVVAMNTSELFSCERRNLECAGLASLRFWVAAGYLGLSSSVIGLADCFRSSSLVGADSCQTVFGKLTSD